MSDAFFRAGIGACIRNAQGHVLACHRVGATDGAWQMPQGGIAAGESVEAALWREVNEEIGAGPPALRLVRQRTDWLAYELPLEARSPKVGLGQVQKWFLLDAAPSLEPRIDQKEFDRWQWMSARELLTCAVAFRRATYEHVLSEFGFAA